MLALNPETGAVAAALALSGVPTRLVAGPAPGGVDHRLYLVEAQPGPDGDAAGGRWRLLGLDALTLEIRSELALPFMPSGFVVAPDGDDAYALTPPNDTLRRIDLATGADSVHARLPGAGLGLAAAGDSVYVTNPYRSEVWVVDRRRGRAHRTIRVGLHPVAIAVSGSAQRP